MEIDVNKQLLKEDFFELFKVQLKKDFEGSGLNGDFAETLPPAFESLKEKIHHELVRLSQRNASALPGLLYRIDISDFQLRRYQQENKTMDFEEVLAELIIKRVLQKVILRKKFSS
ncbi:hypothetical protein CNR22_00985 [Sphingobacteriaceae bacterium]|nr:hypothetical protein CNR22_00985 [Sphingobacteriaceae bacterium]